MGEVLGIDLGTTNTVIAGRVEGGKVTALGDADGQKLMPSVVSFHPNGSVLVGQSAKDRRVIDARNTADGTIYAIEKALKELGDNVPASELSSIESTISDLKAAMEGEDVQRIRSLTEQLQQASHALSQQMYSQQAGEAAPGPNGDSAQTGEAGEEDVVEGDFRQV